MAEQLLRGVVVSAGQRIDDGLVAVDGDRLSWVGPVRSWRGAPPPPPTERFVLPGLIDVHCHGGAGFGFPEADASGMTIAVEHHQAHGTTSLLGSLVSAPVDVLEKQIRILVPLVESGRLAGIHLEGPFLATAQCGAQDPNAIIPGDPEVLTGLLTAGEGHVRSMTLAPETPRFGELLRVMEEHRVLPSFGHTDASAAVTRAAIDRTGGAPVSATHLFNGMPQMHHRAPGPVAACLAGAARCALVVELIADGVHLADDTVSAVFDMVGPDHIALVTDAMAAAGMPDGRYPLGPKLVEVVDGVARLVDHPRGIAGGTARLVDVLRRVVRRAGVPLVDAITSASSTPARLLGIDDEVGDLVPGRRADVLVTDADLTPVAVMRSGGWTTGSPQQRGN
ncbi:N-acetylglucosamine-6-phosphate deacetylase [Pseudonocardia spinosispora]|uniref:N-acetylglucosamine-6-phosphate deacetylase n=1 Tax=Pseudonocardia spinosispora TaxID=103441 RepID=UPI0003FA8E8C|nr:amidohydrolase family protein [Pseudonocardia spinosispora]